MGKVGRTEGSGRKGTETPQVERCLSRPRRRTLSLDLRDRSRNSSLTFSETFTGAFRADWPNDWTHKSSPGPKLEGNAGSLRGSGGLLTSLLAGTYADSSQLVRVIWNPDNDRTWGIAARHGGQNDGSQSAYYCVLDNGTSPKLEIVRYDSGTPTTLASDSVVAPTTNQWLRCEIEGSDIRAKVWDQGTVEPSAWNIETTDATYATGQVGTLLGATANQSVVLDDYRLEPRSATGFEAYNKALTSFVDDAATTRINGTYRGDPAILNYNPTTQQIVVQKPDGAFVSGWKMSTEQLAHVIKTGSLGGG